MKDLTTEEIIEQHEGWSRHGLKQKFDRALGDSVSPSNPSVVRRLLPYVPKAYKIKFKENIDKALGAKSKSKALLQAKQ